MVPDSLPKLLNVSKTQRFSHVTEVIFRLRTTSKLPETSSNGCEGKFALEQRVLMLETVAVLTEGNQEDQTTSFKFALAS